MPSSVGVGAVRRDGRGARHLETALREQPLEGELPIAIAVDRFLHRVQLDLRSLHPLQIRRNLRREGTGVSAAVLLQLLLVLDETATRILELRLEELIGRVGEHRAILEVLLDEQRCDSLRDQHGRPRVARLVADLECRGILPVAPAVDDTDLDVFRAHPLDEVFHDDRLALVRVEVELLDDSLESRPAQDLLTDHLQAILELCRHRRLDVILRDALRHYQDQCLGAIHIRQGLRVNRRSCGDHDEWQDDEPPAGPCHPQVIFRSVFLAWYHNMPR